MDIGIPKKKKYLRFFQNQVNNIFKKYKEYIVKDITNPVSKYRENSINIVLFNEYCVAENHKIADEICQEN